MPGSKSKVSFRPNAVHSAVDCVTRLSLTKYFRDRRSRFVSQKYDKFPASFTDTYPFCKTTRGYLDVAIMKNSRNCMQSCALDSRHAVSRIFCDVLWHLALPDPPNLKPSHEAFLPRLGMELQGLLCKDLSSKLDMINSPTTYLFSLLYSCIFNWH